MFLFVKGVGRTWVSCVGPWGHWAGHLFTNFSVRSLCSWIYNYTHSAAIWRSLTTGRVAVSQQGSTNNSWKCKPCLFITRQHSPASQVPFPNIWLVASGSRPPLHGQPRCGVTMATRTPCWFCNRDFEICTKTLLEGKLISGYQRIHWPRKLYNTGPHVTLTLAGWVWGRFIAVTLVHAHHCSYIVIPVEWSVTFWSPVSGLKGVGGWTHGSVWGKTFTLCRHEIGMNVNLNARWKHEK